MARKVVKVYLPPALKRVLDRMCSDLGMAESEALRTAFLEYAKSLGFMAGHIRQATNLTDGTLCRPGSNLETDIGTVDLSDE